MASIALLALASCSEDNIETSESVETVENPMLFGIEQIAQTKVSYGDQDNAGLSAKFDVGDNLGVYAFYNNFYYYYNDYGVFAESVIFANEGMWVTESSGAYYASYEPLRSWTFSTLYGTAPHTLDVVAYYPLVSGSGYNPHHLNVVETNGAATLEYYYYSYDGADDSDGYTVNSNVDFMTAHTRYDQYEDQPEQFRAAMLSLTSIPLEFTRQLASLNFQVTKPDGYESEIKVTALTVTFDAPTKFTQTISSSPKIAWDDMTENYSLTASTTCEATLAQTVYNYTPGEHEEDIAVVDDLLEDDELLFFPPETEIWKIVFTITDGGVEKEYTWHAHVAEIVANTHYTLSLELDPSRAN